MNLQLRIKGKVSQMSWVTKKSSGAYGRPGERTELAGERARETGCRILHPCWESTRSVNAQHSDRSALIVETFPVGN